MSSDHLPDPGARASHVEALYAEYLRRHESEAKLDFAAFCADHPSAAEGLRRLHEDAERTHVALRAVQGAGPAPGSFAARVRQRYGAGVDPEVSLEPGPGGSPSSELVRRLARRAPAGSHYTLEGELARGGMGAILKIWDEDLRRHLAMKVVLGQGEPTSSDAKPPVEAKQLARFLEEAQVTGQLDHPGIVPVHELGFDSDGRVYFTMKLVKGRDLKTIFDLVFEEQQGWNETRALGVILKVCEAMAYAHSKGVIHRDLKPANVMVGSFGEVYVMDWGLARVLGREDTHDIRLRPEFGSSFASVKTERREEREDAPDSPLVTMDGDVLGTPAYMPLEQAQGEIEKLSPRSDVYAIGAMLYHLLARQTPYVAPKARISNRTVLAMVLQGPPAALSALHKDVPAELVAICEKAMSRDPAQRYPDTLALGEDLRAYLEHRVVGAYEAGAWAEARKWVERNRPLAAALAAAVLLLVAGLATSLVFKTRADARAADLQAANTTIQQRNTDLTTATRAAQESEKSAQEQEQLATQKANDVLALSAIQDLKELEDRAAALWPANPEMVPKYEAWLRDARALIEGRAADPSRGIKSKPSLAQHEAKLVEVRQRAKPRWKGAEARSKRSEDAAQLGLHVAELEGAVNEHRTYEFEQGEDGWWHAQLSKLVADLKGFTDEQTGGLFSSGVSEKNGWGIVKRAEFAGTIGERSVNGPVASRLWLDAIAAIESSPKYGGLKLAPQLGLLPIGADPASGLWEFAHLQTGEPAVRDADGKLTVTEEMGLVFVLIPSGTFWMGAQKTDENGQNYDPQAVAKESPVHEVTLGAYMLSKYEMTQGQWSRIAARNPSNYGPSSNFNAHQHDLTQPVEQVTWTDCLELLERIGLVLPSEAQWENGCRGGTDTPWWTGAERESLRGKINLADQAAQRAGALWGDIKDWPDLEDGWVVHAPAGSLAANPYGLHEILGNVWEWCRDGYDNYSAAKQLDPVKPWSGASPRAFRGGSFTNASSNARSAGRSDGTPEHQYDSLGLRPAKGISP